MKKESKVQLAYDYIFKLIKKGIIPFEKKLPTEDELAQTLNVSRVTIRKALDILKEDGYVKGRRGQGNFVIKNIHEKKTVSLVAGQTPLYSSLLTKIDNIDFSFSSDFSNEHDKSALEMDSSVVIRATRWYQNNHQNVAVCHTILDPTFFEDKELDFANCEQKQVLAYLEEQLYQDITTSHLEVLFVHVASEEFEQPIFNSTPEQFILLREQLTNSNGKYICENKFYLPLTQARIRLSLTK